MTEPTDLVAVGHKGFAWVELETRGRAAHGSRPRDGRDAILRMGRVLARLEALDRELQARPPHPVVGSPSLHASLIEGGRELSHLPRPLHAAARARTIVGEPPERALEECEAVLASLRAEDAEFEASARRMFERPAYETPPGHELPERLQRALAGIGREARREGVTFWTDAAILGHAGIPSLVFGPGGEGLHGLVEHVRIDEVLACRDALVALARGFCAPS